MQCPKCGTDNREGRKFCAECGAPMNVRCPSCGAENEPAEKFCGECGAPLSAPISPSVSATPPVQAREIPGERRHLTILFCDLVGSVTLAAQVDPEEWRATVTGYQRAAAEAITRFEGESRALRRRRDHGLLWLPGRARQRRRARDARLEKIPAQRVHHPVLV
jgi:hypothetical protein